MQSRHAALDRAVRWTRPEQIHLTLKFLGEVPDPDVPAVCDAMVAVAGRFGPVEFAVRKAGCFPPGGSARIFWAGLDEPTGRLARLRDACEDAFTDMGYPREDRAFKPHLTVGRVKDPRSSRQVRNTAAAEAAFDAGRQTADEIVLFQSILAPQGATYVALSRASLAGSE
jgi:2'-5' RNA ligase